MSAVAFRLKVTLTVSLLRLIPIECRKHVVRLLPAGVGVRKSGNSLRPSVHWLTDWFVLKERHQLRRCDV